MSASQPTPPDETAPTWTLSGFGDEIDPDPIVQLAVLSALGASHIEVRSAWGTNIVDLDQQQLDTLATTISDRGFGVSAIASPVGKVDVAAPIAEELQRLDAAIAAADKLDTKYIRVFSFYRAEGRTPADIRDDVLSHMTALAERAAESGKVLVHENEKDIYGDTPERCLDIVDHVGLSSLKIAWDNANFVQVGVKPHTDGFALLAPHLEYLQVKDARAADASVVPAGEGDGELRETLQSLVDLGFNGFASLEPHLSEYTHLGGFSGPAAFGRAARAFRTLTDELGVVLA
ncbi:sugar phosphate isomerase/epimerase family protein [Propionibacteriaceae bacterium Y1685]|uniref:sugar phosphate isomerase/epimerase family protein n=1 Tax=Microlunatus sp. Y1700 TaxID=3418487 RepID=UPI003B7DB130